MNFGSDQITFNTPCGTYDESAFRDDSKNNSSANYEERLNDEKFLKLVITIFTLMLCIFNCLQCRIYATFKTYHFP